MTSCATKWHYHGLITLSTSSAKRCFSDNNCMLSSSTRFLQLRSPGNWIQWIRMPHCFNKLLSLFKESLNSNSSNRGNKLQAGIWWRWAANLASNIKTIVAVSSDNSVQLVGHQSWHLRNLIFLTLFQVLWKFDFDSFFNFSYQKK